MAQNTLDQKTIEDTFKKLGISQSATYQNAQEFTRKFEKCSIYKDVPIFYSTGAAVTPQ